MSEETCISNFFEDQHSSSQEEENQESLTEESQNNSDDSISLSQLTLKEIEPIVINAFYNITPRPIPSSPHYILEEDFSTNPWAMLVATIFLTKTSGKHAWPYMKDFFDKHPTPYHVLEQNPSDLEIFFEKLGLKKRAQIIWKLTYQFLSAKWRRASDLYGIGKYGEDAYRIFCLGHTDLDPSDRYLKLYLDWLRGHTKFLEDNGVEDCECLVEDPVLKYYRVTLRDDG